MIRKKVTKLRAYLGSLAVATTILAQLCAPASFAADAPKKAAPVPVKALAKADWQPSAEFVNYMKQVEGFKGKMYYLFGVPHIGYGHQVVKGEFLPTDDTDEVGYGHKRLKGQSFDTLTKDQATALLIRDIKEKYETASRQWGFRPQGKMAEIAVDFTFNGCPPNRFKRFFKALKDGDQSGILRSYKRYADGKPLTLRNTTFAARYLTPEILAEICGSSATASASLGHSAKPSRVIPVATLKNAVSATDKHSPKVGG